MINNFIGFMCHFGSSQKLFHVVLFFRIIYEFDVLKLYFILYHIGFFVMKRLNI